MESNIKENIFEMKRINSENNKFLSLKFVDNKNEIKSENNKYANITKENEQLSNVLRHKTTKYFGIKFYHVGYTYVFGFINGFSEPLFCIDNKWYFHSIIYVIELIIYIVGNRYLYRKIEHWKQIIFNILLMTFFIFYSLLILLNPGIIITYKKCNKYNGYCEKCNIYYNHEENIEHCSECDICIKKIDHHCHVIRKCITKKNIIIFILMVSNFMILYLFSLINFIIYIIHYFSGK